MQRNSRVSDMGGSCQLLSIFAMLHQQLLFGIFDVIVSLLSDSSANIILYIHLYSP